VATEVAVAAAEAAAAAADIKVGEVAVDEAVVIKVGEVAVGEAVAIRAAEVEEAVVELQEVVETLVLLRSSSTFISFDFQTLFLCIDTDSYLTGIHVLRTLNPILRSPKQKMTS
jgi:hypothetical protein